MAKRPPFSHLTQVKDMAAQATMRLLWDQFEVLQERTEREQSVLAGGLKTSTVVPGLIRRAQQIQASGVAEPPDTGPPPPPPLPPSSQLTIVDNQYFQRDGQPVLPIFCHFMEAFSLYTRDPATVTSELTAIANAGYTGIRFLDVLNGQPYWEGREINPIDVESEGIDIDATPDYYTELEDFLTLCRDKGLLVNWSRGDQYPYSQDDRETHFTNLGNLANNIGIDVIGVFEGVNEYFTNGVELDTLLPLMVRFSDEAGTGMIRALSSPYIAEAAGNLAETSDGVPLAMAHGLREGNLITKMRAIYSVREDFWPGKPVWQDEPPGSGTGSTEEQDEMDEQGLPLMAVLSLLCDQPYTVVLSNGVRFYDAISDEVGFATVPAAVAALPNDLMQWPQVITAGDTAAELESPDGDPSISGPGADNPWIDQRFDLAQGKLAAVIYGGAGTIRIRPRHRKWVGNVYKFTDDSPYLELVNSFNLEKDEIQELSYNPDDVRGCLILGDVG